MGLKGLATHRLRADDLGRQLPKVTILAYVLCTNVKKDHKTVKLTNRK